MSHFVRFPESVMVPAGTLTGEEGVLRASRWYIVNY
jgi:hypothetical protein